MDTSAQTSTTVTVRNVLVLLDLTESQRERLEAAAPHARFSYSTRRRASSALVGRSCGRPENGCCLVMSAPPV